MVWGERRKKFFAVKNSMEGGGKKEKMDQA
jgi:hypothetical protein